MQTYIITLITIQAVLLFGITVILFVTFYRNMVLKKREESLLNSQIRQRDFIPVLVHELRAPLSVIQGASDLLLKEVKDLSADQIHTLLGQIKTSSGSLLKMVGDILDVSKMDAGRFEVNRVYANINNVLKEECGYFQPLAEIKNINLDCQTDQSISNSSFDPERIKQVLNNLLSNALKFIPEHGTISVESKKLGNYVQVAVSDTGEGISDRDKPYLFHRFAQTQSHNHVKERGTGLGLYIAKGIVDAHGGKIWVEDNKPVGARFVFTLPLV
jgi:signal transduction histidine kinase